MRIEMPYYNLQIEPGKTLSTVAKNTDEALAEFGKELGKRLTLEKQDQAAAYLLDEWTKGPH